ncbi:tigger transposable element-derived protein 4-like [Trichechus manatus latirostris]|uniref:Tigger transposable element-derived protein 4-like n=1 Tax=Trichechus manatus latirostris TaxID=127582 RepID=A0A2Y9RLN5_TRIMA|nr:tigger transposable element-derived protein 4-like [Trichechus manatus latirostris]XP_023592845.1 tigger transposable element-derived protein 4-like [Trichechus manatus latirostris]
MDKRVRNLSLKEKFDVVKMITEEKRTVKEAVNKFKCSKTQIYSIMEERDKIIEKYMNSINANIKKGRGDGNQQSVFEWFLQASASNVPISGPILQAKAKETAKLLKVDGFSVSNGWLQSFKKKHGITCNVACGESNGVGMQVQAAVNDIYSGVSENRVSATSYVVIDKEIATEMDDINLQEIVGLQSKDDNDEDIPLEEAEPVSQAQVFSYIKALKEFGKVKGDQEFFDKAIDLEICFSNFIKKPKQTKQLTLDVLLKSEFYPSLFD